MAAILFNGAKPTEYCQYHFTEGPMWNLVKTAQAVSVKAFKNLQFYICI